MLDAETKARIDSARDILVGKVPDPKSQVEQITIALIYKFMDDMDRQSEELGGVATFFAGEFKKYAWNRLLDKSLGGHERLTLYAEGVTVMDRNPNIPQLFRDIFKGAFLPYRDPETLNLFLKEINGFSYDHSERLGDAFEYLLSVLGSQGEAGQFRTPRHIIDFIVRIVDPQKHETVLDPACGTAGFLISAYKHILAQNSTERPGDRLSGDERARLMGNFCGYDISPDMVRLSRANLYLHGFASPRIHEYDTLTSEDRWDERYDVIMANPPFMSPKGGIRPHNRFSIKATRSEVLFVDYIAEHLHVNGRAGVIVPEGIIFQSQNAYKSLRKMLVENYLWCVVSLPSGVFNPYSGVKTSILLLDKGLAKRTDEILFVKVEADGFDLGAQRRPVERNDLPEAERRIAAWRAGNRPAAGGIVHAVSRKRILGSTDCSLSGDRYKDNGLHVSMQWPMVKLGEIACIIAGQSPPGEAYNDQCDGMPFYQGKSEFGDVFLGSPVKWTREVTRTAKPNDILMSVRAPVGPVNITVNDICIGRGLAAIRTDDDKVDHWYLFYVLRQLEPKIKGNAGVTFPSINKADIKSLEIPLPPLDVQRQIVAELDGYRKIIEGARQVIANYKPTIRIDPKWPRVKLGALTSHIASGATPLGGKDTYLSEGILFVRSQNVLRGECDFSDAAYISPETHRIMARSRLQKNDVLLNITGASIGRSAVYELEDEANVNQHVCSIRTDHKRLIPLFLCYQINDAAFQDRIMQIQSGASRQALNYQQIRDFDIALPPLAEQERAVQGLQSERFLVDANRQLIELFEQKIQDKLAEIWGESVDAKP